MGEQCEHKETKYLGKTYVNKIKYKVFICENCQKVLPVPDKDEDE